MCLDWYSGFLFSWEVTMTHNVLTRLAGVGVLPYSAGGGGGDHHPSRGGACATCRSFDADWPGDRGFW